MEHPDIQHKEELEVVVVKEAMEQPVTEKVKVVPVVAGEAVVEVEVSTTPIAILVMEEMQDMLFVY